MRGLAELGLRVRSFARSRLADLHQELAVGRELRDLVVLLAVAADPDAAVLVHENSVLVLRPVVALAGPAPGAQQIAVGIELHHRRRGGAALRGGRVLRCALLVVEQALRAVDDPDAVVAIGGEARRPGRGIPLPGSGLGQNGSGRNEGASWAAADTDAAKPARRTRIDRMASSRVVPRQGAGPRHILADIRAPRTRVSATAKGSSCCILSRHQQRSQFSRRKPDEA